MKLKLPLILFLTALPAAAVIVAPNAAAQNADGSINYKFKSGDTLIDLAQRYFKRDDLYRVVQRQNGIRYPRAIPVGRTIRISRSVLKYKRSTARLVSVRGNVMQNGKRAKSGDLLNEGAKLSTAGSSYVTLQLDDGSRVSMPSNSSMTIKLLRRYTLGNSLDYDFAVTKGGARSKVTPLKSKNDRYRVRSPKAVSAVRGTDFQVRYDPENNLDFAEVVEGGLGVATGGKPAEALPSGKGLAVAANGQSRIDSLLPPPELIDASKTQVRSSLTFSTKPKPAERGYRYTISSDAGFVNIVSDQIADSSEYTLAKLDNGAYFLRARAIARSGLQGIPTTHAFRRRLNDVKLNAGKADDGFTFAWVGSGEGVRRYHFQLAKDKKDAALVIDEAGLEAEKISISDLAPGDYYWRVGSSQYLNGEAAKDWSEFEKISISE